jgi:hypothetical protein
MNLFLLDLDPKKNALYHCDKHIVKMILELTQMLYTAWYVLEGTDGPWKQRVPPNPYKAAHIKHPTNIWLRSGDENYKLACKHGQEFLKEYTRRYQRVHACQPHFEWLAANIPPSIPKIPAPTQLPQAMPDQYKINNLTGSMEDTVAAYREYYVGEKLRFAKYKNTSWPEWLPQLTDKEIANLQKKFQQEKEEKESRKRKRKETQKPKKDTNSTEQKSISRRRKAKVEIQ